LAFGWTVGDADDHIIAQGSGDLSKERYDRRFTVLRLALQQVFDLYQPDEFAIEKPVRFRGRKNPALEVAYQSVISWARDNFKKAKIYSYHPATWRVGVAGRSNSSKGEVMRIVHIHFPDLPEKTPDHITDAIGIMLFHYAMRRREDMIREAENA
jgi:Holliday junction resolvasome RuvABC endonuclease subunit